MAGGWTNQSVRTITVPTGATTGKRVIIGEQPGDRALSIYDAANNLVYVITDEGEAISVDPASDQSAVMIGGDFQLHDSAGDSVLLTIDQNGADGPADFQIQVAPAAFGARNGGLKVFAASADDSIPPTVTAVERDISGSVLVYDGPNSTNNLVHFGRYACTTNANGDSSIAHGCHFTPAGFTPTPAPTSFTQQGTQIMAWQNLTTSTTASFRILNSNGTPFVGTMNVYFQFWG